MTFLEQCRAKVEANKLRRLKNMRHQVKHFDYVPTIRRKIGRPKKRQYALT